MYLAFLRVREIAAGLRGVLGRGIHRRLMGRLNGDCHVYFRGVVGVGRSLRLWASRLRRRGGWWCLMVLGDGQVRGLEDGGDLFSFFLGSSSPG